jgi:hypothetical protein
VEVEAEREAARERMRSSQWRSGGVVWCGRKRVVVKREGVVGKRATGSGDGAWGREQQVGRGRGRGWQRRGWWLVISQPSPAGDASNAGECESEGPGGLVGPDLPLDTSRAGTLQAAIVSAAWLRVSVSSLLLLLGRALRLLGPWPAWSGLLGVRLAAGGWRLAAGSLAHARLSPSAAPERVHCLGLSACQSRGTYYLLPTTRPSGQNARRRQDAARRRQAALRPVDVSSRPGSVDLPGCHGTTSRHLPPNLPTPNYTHTTHCTQTFPCRPAYPPLSSPACHPLRRVLFTAVQFGSLLSSPIKSSRLYLSHQTRSIADVIASLLLVLPCERDQNMSVDSSPHRHTGHPSPTFAFATRVLFCLVWFSLVQHAVYS